MGRMHRAKEGTGRCGVTGRLAGCDRWRNMQAGGQEHTCRQAHTFRGAQAGGLG